ncbi:hypothetical protein RND71_040646 [Anisodus tanguticus]|uniref:Uncharacterized protein n=1 Tax=Anisodus tanguticus TaxID=243964 RepID=A0AAE1QTX8_9SOLA|nr:hypothetical protein RND71_040646 [Anisodus tanguticus]
MTAEMWWPEGLISPEKGKRRSEIYVFVVGFVVSWYDKMTKIKRKEGRSTEDSRESKRPKCQTPLEELVERAILESPIVQSTNSQNEPQYSNTDESIESKETSKVEVSEDYHNEHPEDNQESGDKTEKNKVDKKDEKDKEDKEKNE